MQVKLGLPADSYPSHALLRQLQRDRVGAGQADNQRHLHLNLAGGLHLDELGQVLHHFLLRESSVYEE